MFCRGERGCGFRRLCVGIVIGSELCEGATCFCREREFRWGNLRGKLLYEFVMVAL